MRARNIMKPLLGRVMPQLAKWYLRKPRKSRWQGVEVSVEPGVFHPGLFLSTRFMLRFLENYPLLGSSFLEIGAGSGMISIWAAQQGANVTATDISERAIRNIISNAESNHVQMEVACSDLFQNLPHTDFDFIVINPPYYPGVPKNEAEYAWYCGPGFEYFQILFGGMKDYCNHKTQIFMVLSEDCDLNRIGQIAAENHWDFVEIQRKQIMAEWNYIFSIRPSSKA